MLRLVAPSLTPISVHYTASSIPVGSKHGEYVGFSADPTLSDSSLPQLVDERVQRRMDMRSARDQGFSLQRHGFQLSSWPTGVRDFSDSSAVLRDYVPEVEALVATAMSASGAGNVKAVVVWDLCLRSSELVNEFQVAVQAADGASAGCTLDRLAPVPLAHVDFFSPRDVRRRLRQRWTTPTDTLSTFMRADFGAKGLSREADLPACLASRIVSVNVWRSIDRQHPVRRCPLALCDPESLAADELVPFEIRCPDAAFAEAHVLADGAAAHRWYHYPQMRHDECLMFVSGDTAERFPSAPHTSVDLPGTTSSDPPRNSIEARVFVLFDE